MEKNMSGLPMPSGRKDSLTDMERQMLENCGWQEGDPVPNLADSLAGEELPTHHPDLDPDHKFTGPAKAADFSTLPEDKQREIMESVQQAKRQKEQIEAARKQQLSGAAPGVNQAIAAATSGDGLDVIDDDPAAAYTGYGFCPQCRAPGAQRERRINGNDICKNGHVYPTKDALKAPTDKPAEKPQAEEAEVEAPEQSTTGHDHKLENCPHCGWNLKLRDIPDPSDAEKRLFYTCFVTGKRYKRESNFFDGTLRVTYRSLTVTESDTALEQVSKDAAAGFIVDRGEFFRWVNNYRLAMGVDRVEIDGEVRKIPTLEEWVEKNPPKDGSTDENSMRRYAEWFQKSYFTTESARRIIGLNFSRFERFCEKLEARADDSDFYAGIGS